MFRTRQILLVLIFALFAGLQRGAVMARYTTTPIEPAHSVADATHNWDETPPQAERTSSHVPARWVIEDVDVSKVFDDMTTRNMVLDASGHLHIAYGENHLYYAWHDGTAWQYQTVDPAQGVGTEASITLDSGENPHIVYYDSTNSALKYARWTGNAWDIQSVDSGTASYLYTSVVVDNDDMPHISYYSGYALKYAYQTETGWHTQFVDTDWTGFYTSLALDQDGNPHISYGGGSGLKYAHWTGSAWDIQVLDAKNDNEDWDTSLVLDSMGYPHISYHDVGDNGLKYVHWTGSAWDLQTVDSAGKCTSLGLNAADQPHISYYDTTNQTLKYARWTGQTWDIQNVDSADANCYTSLALDHQDTPRIGYLGSDADLKYARRLESTWEIQTVDRQSDGGRYVSLVLDHDDHPHISYQAVEDRALTYARRTGDAWDFETVDDVIGQNSLVLDENDVPHISYTNLGSVLRYANWSGSTWNIQDVDNGGNEDTKNSLALDQQGNPHISYGSNGLRYARWITTGWQIQTIDDIFYANSLVLDIDDQPHIGYHGGYPDFDLRYARWASDTWDIQIVDNYGLGMNNYVSLALDKEGHPHISYIGSTWAFLQYAHWTGDTWAIEIVDTETNNGRYSVLVLDQHDYPHISYATGSGLKYARWTGSLWEIQSVDSDAVDYDTSMALGKDGYPHIGYSDPAGGDVKYARLLPPLALEKHATPNDNLYNNDIITYVLTLSGPGLNAQLLDLLPASVRYISNSITGTLSPPATYSATIHAITWKGTLPITMDQEIRFQVTPNITGSLLLAPPIVNTAWLTDTENHQSVSDCIISNAYRLYLPLTLKSYPSIPPP